MFGALQGSLKYVILGVSHGWVYWGQLGFNTAALDENGYWGRSYLLQQLPSLIQLLAPRSLSVRPQIASSSVVIFPIPYFFYFLPYYSAWFCPSPNQPWSLSPQTTPPTPFLKWCTTMVFPTLQPQNRPDRACCRQSPKSGFGKEHGCSTSLALEVFKSLGTKDVCSKGMITEMSVGSTGLLLRSE